MSFAFVAAGSAAASIAGGLISAKASKKAANTQAAALQKSTDEQTKLTREQMALQEPFRQAGLTGLSEYQRRLGLGGDPTSAGYGDLAKGFTFNQDDPSYQFRFSEGQRALEHDAAARGGFMGGSTGKALVRYGQGAASQEYQNAFERWNQDRTFQANSLLGLTSTGAGAVGAQGGYLGNLSGQVGANYAGIGDARASGYIGQANAFNSAISGVTNAASGYANYGLMKDWYGQQPLSEVPAVNPFAKR